MIKYSKSSMHDFYNVTFFKGRNQNGEGQYLFKESETIFAKENLAVNLFEYSEVPKNGFRLDSEEIQSYIKSLNPQGRKYLNIIDVKISDDVDDDLKIEYCRDLIGPYTSEALLHGLDDYTGFKVSVNEVTKISDPVVSDVSPENIHYISVYVSSRFLEDGSKKLSERLHKSFDEKRYVDTNIPFFMIMVIMSGMSGR